MSTNALSSAAGTPPPVPTALGDFAGLARLRTQSAQQTPEAQREVARQFEALFIQQMLKTMRAASPGDSLVDSDASRTMRDFHDQKLAESLSQRGDFGIAQLLLKQIAPDAASGRQAGPAIPAAGPAPKLDANALEVLRRVERVRDDGRLEATTAPVASAAYKPGTPEAFVREVWPHAQAAARQLGVAPEVLVAQAVLESAWGRSMPTRADGTPSFNLFGIKADRRWQGARVENATTEFVGGRSVREVAGFRAYGSWGESFADYARFIQDNPRYRQALASAADNSAYLHELHKAGYATDPGYAAKIKRILGGDALNEALRGMGVNTGINTGVNLSAGTAVPGPG